MKHNEEMPEFPSNDIQHFMFVDTKEQRDSITNPYRMAILTVLAKGISDYETNTTIEKKELDDGTIITLSMEQQQPIRRYWVTVNEILEVINESNPELEMSNYKCYYHLRVLQSQDLIEQYPPIELDASGGSKRIRGMHFKTRARILYPSFVDITENSISKIMDIISNTFKLKFSKSDKIRFAKLLGKYREKYNSVLSRIAEEVEVMDVDYAYLTQMLLRFAHLFLSDNEEFITHLQEGKAIVSRSSDSDVWFIE